MILVTGATGSVGGEVCRLLHRANRPFRAMCRKPEQIDRFREEGMEAVQGDFDRPETLATAMQGIDLLLLISAPTPRQAEHEIAAIDAARRAGVGRIVKISASDSNVRTPVPWAKAHALIEQHLRSTDIDWTVLRASAFMQNLLWLKTPLSKGFLPQVADKGVVGWIDTRDVARTAVTVMGEEGHHRATYFLTGPEGLDMRQIAGRLSDVFARRVRYIDLPNPIFAAILRLSGNSRWMTKGLVVQFDHVVAGHHDIDITCEVERLTGAPPRSLSEFARDYRDAFFETS